MIQSFGTFDLTAPWVVVTSLYDTFADLVPRTVRLPGADGGFDTIGDGAAPQAIGVIRAEVTVIAPDAATMRGYRQNVRAMAAAGVQTLVRANGDWCRARVSNIVSSQHTGRHTDLFQPMQITWQAADPAWTRQGTEAWAWGDGTPWGSAAWGGTAPAIPLTGTTTSHTETVPGTLPTAPRMVLTPGAGNTLTDPVIQRLVNGAVVDEVGYSGTLTNGQRLTVDCRRLAVLVDTTDAYADFNYRRGGWFRLQPGQNAIRVVCGSPTDSGTLRLRYYTRWH